MSDQTDNQTEPFSLVTKKDGLSADLVRELEGRLTVNRLAKTGLFRKLEILYEEHYFDIFLHRSVLDRALIDMFSPYDNIRKDVLDWLNLENDSFVFACERALLEPAAVYDTFITVKNILKDARTTNHSARKKNS